MFVFIEERGDPARRLVRRQHLARVKEGRGLGKRRHASVKREEPALGRPLRGPRAHT